MLVFDNPSLSVCFSVLLNAVVKHFDLSNLQEKEFVWAYGSRERRIQHNGEARQQEQGAGRSHVKLKT